LKLRPLFQPKLNYGRTTESPFWITPCYVTAFSTVWITPTLHHTFSSSERHASPRLTHHFSRSTVWKAGDVLSSLPFSSPLPFLPLSLFFFFLFDIQLVGQTTTSCAKCPLLDSLRIAPLRSTILFLGSHESSLPTSLPYIVLSARGF